MSRGISWKWIQHLHGCKYECDVNIKIPNLERGMVRLYLHTDTEINKSKQEKKKDREKKDREKKDRETCKIAKIIL